jgi:putative ABC transport system permease protein
LFSKIVGPIRNLLLVITGFICIVSGISILVSIYNSMSDRKHEIAIMRSLGAGRGTVMTVVLLESLMISLIGGVVGWLAGHALIGLASGKIEEESGVVVSAFDLAPEMPELSYLLGEALTPNISVEIWLIPILIALAIIVGFLPAVSAYRTDVAEALQSTP